MNLKDKITQGAAVVGTFCALPHPSAAEIVGYAGLDFVCIDAEHAPIGRDLIENMLRALDVTGTASMVRVPGVSSELIASALDSGAGSILIPRVGTASDAELAVKAVRYPPVGMRGAGPGRAARYGGDVMGYVGEANDRHLLLLQIETAEAVENIESIVAVQGIDMIFIGPGDLSVSLGYTKAEDQEKLFSCMEHIVKAALSASLPVGMFRMGTGDLARWRALGVSLFIVGSDAMFLASGAATLGAGAKSALTSE